MYGNDHPEGLFLFPPPWAIIWISQSQIMSRRELPFYFLVQCSLHKALLILFVLTEAIWVTGTWKEKGKWPIVRGPVARRPIWGFTSLLLLKQQMDRQKRSQSFASHHFSCTVRSHFDVKVYLLPFCLMLDWIPTNKGGRWFSHLIMRERERESVSGLGRFITQTQEGRPVIKLLVPSHPVQAI